MAAIKVYVPRETAAISVGANEVAMEIERQAKQAGKSIHLIRNGSWGTSWLEPLVEAEVGDSRAAYGNVTAGDVAGLFEAGFNVDDTGDIWHWNKTSGYDMLAGTSGSFPNGIAISANGDALFINYWFAGKTVKYDLATNSVVATHRSGLTDNLTVVGNAVWVGTHDITLADLEKCPPEVAQCTLPFTIHVLSESDLIPLQSYQFDSEVFGAATVAIPVGEFIWLGTFHGDRIARHKLN